MVEGKPISIGNVAYVLGTDAKRLYQWYKDYLSGFRESERDGRIGRDDIEVRRSGGRKRKFFKQFPEIEETYKYCLRIRKWYEPIRPRYSDRKYKIKEADLMLNTKEGMESKVEEIRNIANFLRSNSTPILRYFYRRESNAKAEALNQNLQRFVSVNYGARNTDFFLYRITLHFS